MLSNFLRNRLNHDFLRGRLSWASRKNHLRENILNLTERDASAATSKGLESNLSLDIDLNGLIVRYMSNNATIEIDRFAEVFKALSNPNRLRIFQRLATCCRPGTVSVIDACETACVGELGRELDIVPSTVSHHIKELRQAGLIQTRRRGQKIECWIDPGVVEQLRGFFSF